MNIDEVGEFLEHNGLTDEEIDAYFEHHGVKGQKWGTRKQRVATKVVAAAAGLAAIRFLNKGTGVVNTPILAIAGASAVAGAHFSRKIIEDFGDTKLQDLPQQG